MAIKGVILAGPTASGKTALAVRLAQALNGVVVNADSMQVYSDLQHLSARPTVEEMQGVPHLLFGHIAAEQHYSVGRWLQDVESVLDDLQGRWVIFCGGTGLYFRALQEGLINTPEIPHEVKEEVSRLYVEQGHEGFLRLCKERHADSFAHLGFFDRQRVLRAAEVVFATGEPLSAWQDRQSSPLLPDAHRVVLLPPREELYRRIDDRSESIFSLAESEAAKLFARALPQDLPIMGCLGLREMRALQEGVLSRSEACAKLAQSTRQYAKRQQTWLRHQMSREHEVAGFGEECNAEELVLSLSGQRIDPING